MSPWLRSLLIGAGPFWAMGFVYHLGNLFVKTFDIYEEGALASGGWTALCLLFTLTGAVLGIQDDLAAKAARRAAPALKVVLRPRLSLSVVKHAALRILPRRDLAVRSGEALRRLRHGDPRGLLVRSRGLPEPGLRPRVGGGLMLAVVKLWRGLRIHAETALILLFLVFFLGLVSAAALLFFAAVSGDEQAMRPLIELSAVLGLAFFLVFFVFLNLEKPKPNLDRRERSAGRAPSRSLVLRAQAARRCAYCHGEVSASDPARSCGGCGTAIHADCWSEAEVCPSLGCARLPQRSR